jgi:hypothetical protein
MNNRIMNNRMMNNRIVKRVRLEPPNIILCNGASYIDYDEIVNLDLTELLRLGAPRILISSRFESTVATVQKPILPIDTAKKSRELTLRALWLTTIGNRIGTEDVFEQAGRLNCVYLPVSDTPGEQHKNLLRPNYSDTLYICLPTLDKILREHKYL